MAVSWGREKRAYHHNWFGCCCCCWKGSPLYFFHAAGDRFLNEFSCFIFSSYGKHLILFSRIHQKCVCVRCALRCPVCTENGSVKTAKLPNVENVCGIPTTERRRIKKNSTKLHSFWWREGASWVLLFFFFCSPSDLHILIERASTPSRTVET